MRIRIIMMIKYSSTKDYYLTQNIINFTVKTLVRHHLNHV